MGGLDLEESSLPFRAYYSTEEGKFYEREIHSIFRVIQGKETYEALAQNTARPFLLSSYNFAGMN